MDQRQQKEDFLINEAGFVAAVLDSLAALWVDDKGVGRSLLVESETFSYLVTEAARRARRLWTELAA